MRSKPQGGDWVKILPPIKEPNRACGNCGCSKPPIRRDRASKPGKMTCCAGCGSAWDSCPDADQIAQRCAEINANRPRGNRTAMAASGIKVCKLILRKRTKIKVDR